MRRVVLCAAVFVAVACADTGVAVAQVPDDPRDLIPRNPVPEGVCVPTTAVCVTGIDNTVDEATGTAVETAVSTAGTAVATAEQARRDAEAATAPYVTLVSQTVANARATVDAKYNEALDTIDRVCAPAVGSSQLCIAGLGTTIRDPQAGCYDDPSDPLYAVDPCW